MAVAEIKKADFIIHKSRLDAVLSAIQRTGACEIAPFAQEDGEAESPVHPDLPAIESLLGETRFLLRFLEPHFKDSVSSLARIMGERDAISLQEGAALESEVPVAEISREMRALERRLMEIRSEMSQLGSTESLLENLKEFPYPLSLVTRGTESVKSILGTMPTGQIEQWRRGADGLLGPMGESFTAPFGEKDKEGWVALFFAASAEKEALDLCARHSLSRVDLPQHLEGTTVQELGVLVRKKEALAAEEGKILEKVSEASGKWVPQIRKLNDYWSILRDKCQSLSSARATEQVVLLRGWIPESKVREVKDAIVPYVDAVELLLSDPEPGDNPPTVMHNPSWCHPFEILTNLYGAPRYGETDPTPLLAPFFVVFFGMCLGDGGYGLVMVGGFSYLLSRFGKMPSGLRNFFKLFVITGLSTVVVGALTGSWFGNLIDAFGVFSFLRPLKNWAMIIDPMQQPMQFLAFSLALGTIHLFFGLFIAFFDALRKKDYMAAFADKGGWIVFLTGLLLWGGAAGGILPPGMFFAGKGLSLLGGGVLLVTQGRDKATFVQKLVAGLYSLYGVTSYLGDVLSYSRLLALGLASSALGMIMSMLANLAGDIPYIGWALGITILLVGHVFGFAVNILGAFVHSLRLQYVEFFSKFYTGGGASFSPLCYKTSYVAIKDAPVKPL